MPNINFELFINVEPSLASRVISYINQYILFFKHPITGIGFFNRGWLLIQQIQNSPVPLTYEIQNNLINAVYTINVNMTTGTQFAYQTGFIGLFLYILFMIKNIKFLDKCKLFFNSYILDFINGLRQTLIAILIFSLIYGTSFMNQTNFFYFGLVCSIIITVYKIKEEKCEF